jgi:hypothetical protein
MKRLFPWGSFVAQASGDIAFSHKEIAESSYRYLTQI